MVQRGGPGCDSFLGGGTGGHARHVSAAEIHRQPVDVYGEEAMNRGGEMVFQLQILSSWADRQKQAPPRTKHAFSQQS